MSFKRHKTRNFANVTDIMVVNGNASMDTIKEAFLHQGVINIFKICSYITPLVCN